MPLSSTTKLGAIALGSVLLLVGVIVLVIVLIRRDRAAELKPGGVPHRSLDGTVYWHHANQPAAFLKAVAPYYAPYLEAIADSRTSDPSSYNNTWPMFSIESVVNGWTQNCVAMDPKLYGPRPASAKPGTYSGPSGRCGTFEGFGTWSWTAFEEFLQLMGQTYGITRAAIYEWQFVPREWRTKQASEPKTPPPKNGMQYALWHEGFSGDNFHKPAAMQAYLAEMVDFVALRRIDRVFVLIQPPSLFTKAVTKSSLFASGDLARVLSAFMVALGKKAPSAELGAVLDVDPGKPPDGKATAPSAWSFAPTLPGGLTCADGYKAPDTSNGACPAARDVSSTPAGCPNTFPQAFAWLKALNAQAKKASSSAAQFTVAGWDGEHGGAVGPYGAGPNGVCRAKMDAATAKLPIASCGPAYQTSTSAAAEQCRSKDPKCTLPESSAAGAKTTQAAAYPEMYWVTMIPDGSQASHAQGLRGELADTGCADCPKECVYGDVQVYKGDSCTSCVASCGAGADAMTAAGRKAVEAQAKKQLEGKVTP